MKYLIASVVDWGQFLGRELGGWALIVVSFAIFYMAYDLSTQGKILAVWPLVIVGIFVFRGGIHLLKVAVAARICQQTQDRLYPMPSPAASLPRPTLPASVTRRP